MDTQFLWIFCPIWIGLGVIFAAIGFGMKMYSAKRRKICTIPASATVVDMIETTSYNHDSHRSTTSYCPVIEYYANGDMITSKFSYSSSPKPYEIGDTLNIMYNPNEPKSFIDLGEKTIPLISTIFAIVGVVCILIGLGVLIVGMAFMRNM